MTLLDHARAQERGAAQEAHEKDAKQGLLVQPKPPAAPAPMKVTFAAALPPFYRDTVAAWLRDDCPSLDVGGLVVGDAETTATLWCKSSGVLAGVASLWSTVQGQSERRIRCITPLSAERKRQRSTHRSMP